MRDDRYSFMVVEESLPTATIAEYRQTRGARERSGARGIPARIVARLSRSLLAQRRVR
jgi:hypothetical protein